MNAAGLRTRKPAGPTARVLVLAALTAGLPAGAVAQGLPGGASAINETYRDWQVACATQGAAVRCAMVQVLSNSQSGQRVLAIELRLAGTGETMEGTLVLPFGLDLDQGVALQIDDRASEGWTVRFVTCTQAGCVAPVALDATAIERLKAGTTLRLRAAAYGTAQTLALSVSLTGFTVAFNRLGELPR